MTGNDQVLGVMTGMLKGWKVMKSARSGGGKWKYRV